MSLRYTVLALAAAVLAFSRPAAAQFSTKTYTLTAEDRQSLTDGCDKLRNAVSALRGKASVQRVADVEIFLDAAQRNMNAGTFFSARNVQEAKACLAEGAERALALLAGRAPWERQTGVVVLGYRSAIDGSAQPYQVYIPADYNFDTPTPRRLDVFLHGRGDTLNEPNFIRGTGWVRGNFGSSTLPYLALAPYGRGNNGWRFAGEQDVFEALNDFRTRYKVDPDDVTFRGFSMGGHGCFQIGLHHPDLWAVMSPGAGFVDTIHYLGLKQPLPQWQAPLLHLYDAMDVAANAKDIPLIEYVGALDDKLPQYQLMDAALKAEKAPYQEIVAANTPHRYEAASLKSIMEQFATAHRNPNPTSIDFVTFTLRYPKCYWITLLGLERHWERSEVHARLLPSRELVITTRNVTAMSITIPGGGAASISIDGDVVHHNGPWTGSVILNRASGKWKPGTPGALRKRPGLEGPIDDALFGPVLAVTGTGNAWSEPLARWSQRQLTEFRENWTRYFRAELPEIKDSELTRAQVRDHNLYLFGDPGSNAVLRRVLAKLPIQWTKESITVAGHTYPTDSNVPMLVFPNPENPARYVVIDCGFTFSRADQEGSNAQQFPHLPDYAVIHFNPDSFSDEYTGQVVEAGYFDEHWRLQVAKKQRDANAAP